MIRNYTMRAKIIVHNPLFHLWQICLNNNVFEMPILPNAMENIIFNWFFFTRFHWIIELKHKWPVVDYFLGLTNTPLEAKAIKPQRKWVCPGSTVVSITNIFKFCWTNFTCFSRKLNFFTKCDQKLRKIKPKTKLSLAGQKRPRSNKKKHLNFPFLVAGWEDWSII
jgi:hypothetical protein